MTWRSLRQPGRAGFTLVELLVGLAITGLLMALLLPAIQASRAAAQRSDCASRLKQIGIATEIYSSIFGVLPSTDTGGLHVLQPYINGTIKLYQCPSYAGPERYSVAYGMCYGTFKSSIECNGYYCAIRPADVVDGLSNTAAFSEWISGPDEMTPVSTSAVDRSEPRALIFSVVMPAGSPLTVPSAISVCESMDTSIAPIYSSNRGVHWRGGPAEGTSYTHNLTPNKNSCFLDSIIPGGGLPINAASSRHTHGVNVLFADGSARFISDSVDLKVWQAVGTCNGNEVISGL